jgi:hypothetical protein
VKHPVTSPRRWWLLKARPMDDGILLNPRAFGLRTHGVRAVVRRKAEAKWIMARCYIQAVG